MLVAREERTVEGAVLRQVLCLDPQQLRTSQSELAAIERVRAEDLSYSRFFSEFLLPNRPVLIEGLCESWPALRDWIEENGDQTQINLNYFKECFGDALLNVAECGVRDFSDQRRKQMTMREYVDYWTRHRSLRDSRQEEHSSAEVEPSEDEAILYNKDWHYVKNNPDRIAYTLPLIFSDDWMNLHWDSRSDVSDDYRFVYMGPKGSWTPLHSDVFGSYSWSANVSGRKKWIFFPPEQDVFLKDKFGNLMYNIEEDQKDKGRFPHFHSARPIEIIQKAGEAIFVPSGWFHQVWNEEDTISINHNWANACNIDLLWATLKRDFHAVQKELEDCKGTEGWDEQCQLMLRTLSGWNLIDFARFIFHIAHVQLEVYDNCRCRDTETESRRLLALFSLVRLARVAGELMHFGAVSDLVKSSDGDLHHEAPILARLEEVYAHARAECACDGASP